MPEAIRQASLVFEALGNPIRLGIVKLIAKKCRTYCGEILGQFHLSQPTMSHHLTKLVRAGVLMETKEGVKHCYDLNGPRLKEVGLNPQQLTGT